MWPSLKVQDYVHLKLDLSTLIITVWVPQLVVVALILLKCMCVAVRLLL